MGRYILWLTCWISLILMSGCTSSPSSQGTKGKVQQNPDQVMSQKLTQDAKSLKDSYFVMLSHNPKPIRSWEESDGLVHFFQGKLDSAIKALNHEIEASNDPALKIIRVRTLIELTETYRHLMEIESYLLPQWLSYERGRPNADAYRAWYQWIEFTTLKLREDPSAQVRLQKLKAELGNHPEMASWLVFALDVHAEVPSEPKRPKASYQRWVRFARAVELGSLDKALKILKKIRLKSPLLSFSGGPAGASLKVYDPRVSKSLKSLYTQLGLKVCQDVELAGYYCGRLYELQGDRKNAQRSYQNAQKHLSKLITNPEANVVAHLALSAHTDLRSIRDELNVRLTMLGIQVQNVAPQSSQVERHTSQDPKHAHSTTDHPDSSASSILRSSTDLWRRFGAKSHISSALFPERRGALSLLASAALEEGQGPAVHEVAALELVERWLDDLHYRYAQILINHDERVLAMKVLNAAEEIKYGGRLKGRNRLNRLLLSAYNYLKMDQQRVTVKYFRRLQKDLPALSFALGMTSDVLSGKSFEQKEGNVTSGQ